jgi:hypothetical protein
VSKDTRLRFAKLSPMNIAARMTQLCLDRRAGLNDPKLTAVVRPAGPVLPISCTHDRGWRRPRDSEVGIVVPYSHITVRSVELIDPINDIGNCGQRLKPMQKPAWNVDLRADLIIENEGHYLAKGCRSRSGVDDHVEHSAISASHQLRFASP